MFQYAVHFESCQFITSALIQKPLPMSQQRLAELISSVFAFNYLVSFAALAFEKPQETAKLSVMTDTIFKARLSPPFSSNCISFPVFKGGGRRKKEKKPTESNLASSQAHVTLILGMQPHCSHTPPQHSYVDFHYRQIFKTVFLK